MSFNTCAKDNSPRRRQIIAEIVSTEQRYVQGLSELIDIYVEPALAPAHRDNGNPVVPLSEHRAVFGTVEALLQFHSTVFLPTLISAAGPIVDSESAAQLSDEQTAAAAEQVADVFSMHAAFFKMYSSYINNCDAAQTRIAGWTQTATSGAASMTIRRTWSHGALRAMRVLSAQQNSLHHPQTHQIVESRPLSVSQKKRIKLFLQQCRSHPNHSQLNLEAYLLLPVQRIPRYRLLLQDLVRATDTRKLRNSNALSRALLHISHIASGVNRSKMEHEQGQKLLTWQYRIQASIEGTLVQPYRHLLKDGQVRFKGIEILDDVHSDEIKGVLSPPRLNTSMVRLRNSTQDLLMNMILCNDVVVLCIDAPKGKHPNDQVLLHAMLKLVEPAQIINEVQLKLVDQAGTVFLAVGSNKEALEWKCAFDLHYSH